MKRFYPILACFLLLACNEKDSKGQKNELALFLQKTIDKSEPVVVIDLDKHGKTFIKDIEEQTGKDLCEESRFTAELDFNENKYRFPSFAIKRCKHWNGAHFSIDIMINHNNQVLIHDWVSATNDSRALIPEIIRGKTIERFEKKDDPVRILYTINWNQDEDPKILKEITIEVLKGIEAITNDLSIDFYQQDFSKLKEAQKENIQEKFKWKVGFVGESYPIPPPPPPTPPPAEQLS